MTDTGTAVRYCVDGEKCIGELCGTNREACFRSWRWTGRNIPSLSEVSTDDLLSELKRRIK